MNWIRIFLFALLSLCVTGSAAHIITHMCTRLFRITSPYIALAMQKAAALSFTLPLLFSVIFFRHVGGMFRRTNGGIDGVFWVDRMKIDDGICLAIELAWLCGFLTQLLKTLRAQQRLNRIWRQNRPVADGPRREIFEQCQKRFGLPGVRLFENPALPSPVSAKYGSFLIALPTQPYSGKELHMIFSHEMNHIHCHDLWWRRLILVGSLINWYHPWCVRLLDQLVCGQEIVCDLRASTDHPMFTQREYGAFLVQQSDNEYGNLPVTAFRESKNITIRRLTAMTQAKKTKKPKGLLLAASCAGIMAAALLPAAAVSAQVIAWEEERIYASETGGEVEATELENSGEVHTAYAGDDPSVIEVDLTGEAAVFSNTETIDRLILKNTRALIRIQSMSRGGKITIAVSCNNDSALYRVGVKNADTGEKKYVEGSGTQSYTYSVTADGQYTAYIENRTNQTIRVKGTAIYDD